MTSHWRHLPLAKLAFSELASKSWLASGYAKKTNNGWVKIKGQNTKDDVAYFAFYFQKKNV